MMYETYALDFNSANESTPVTPAMEKHFDADMLLLRQDLLQEPELPPVARAPGGRALSDPHADRQRGPDDEPAPEPSSPRTATTRTSSATRSSGGSPSHNCRLRGSPLTTQPQAARIEAFDAITSYSLYFGGNSPTLGPAKDFVGYPGKTSIAADERNLMEKYSAATGGKVPVIPDITPGFNDRGVRLSINHPAQPREWLPGDGTASTLDNLFRKVALPTVDARAPIIFVTAWNEWNEDSGVEPVPGVATSTDDSPTGTDYTQGYTYGGEGDSALKVLRRDTDCARGLPACKTDPG